MKRIFKFIPAALAMIALASCSNDDLLGSQGKTAAQEGDLIVTVDPLDNGGSITRAYRNESFTTFDFAEGDVLNVYDADLYKHDVYIANAQGKFMCDGDPILTAPQFALFPGDEVVRGYWDRETDKVFAEFAIAPVLTYNSESEKVIDANGSVGYKVDLPMWGVAKKDGDQVKANLRYLTAILKINLKNAFGNANWLRLSNDAEKPLSGTFRAKLDATGAPNAFTDATKTEYTPYGAVALEEGLEDLKTSPTLLIDLRNVPSDASCIFVPIIEGLDGDVDDIRLEYTAFNGEADDITPATVLEKTNAGWAAAANNEKWVDTGCYFYGEEFKHNKMVEAGYAFALTDVTPNAISAMLNQYKTTGSDINFNLVKKFTIDADESIIFDGEYDFDRIDLDKAGHIVAIPALNEGVDITINLTKDDDNTFTTWTNATPNDLYFEDADPLDPFTGTLTFNVGDYADKFGAAAGSADIVINLPEANVVIVGDYTGMTAASTITLTAAKSVSFGNGTTVTKLGVDNLGIAGAQIGAVGDFVIANKAVYTDVTNGLATTDLNTNVTVTGQAVLTGKTLDMSASVKGLLTVNATPAAADDKVIDGNVTVNGNAVIALGAEGEAISGTLKMQGVKKTLSYKSGLINTIEVDLSNTVGQWEQDYVTVKLDELVNDKSVAEFLTLNEIKGHAVFTESLWSGKKITNATYAEKYTVAYGTNFNIFTSAQLASLSSACGSNLTLANNLNLNDKDWKGTKKSADFIGLKVAEAGKTKDNYTYPTIKNLNLTANGGGLFATNAAAASVKNLTISGVKAEPNNKLTGKVSNIGAVYGSAAFDLEIENVTVTGINIVATAPTTGDFAGKISELKNVGGIVGSTTAALTLKKVSTAGSITGYSALGGFVGEAGAAVKAGTATDGSTTCSSSVSLAANFASGLAMDMNYARMGGFVGTIINGANVTIADGSTCTSSITGVAGKMYLSDSTAGDGNFFNYTQDQKFIGFSGTYKHDAGAYMKSYGTININSATVTTTEPFFGTADKWKDDVTKTMASKNQAPLYHFTQQ